MTAREPEREQEYPLARSEGVPTFTYGLLSDIAARIEEEGFPQIKAGTDRLRLHLALFGFLYGSEEDDE